MKRLKWMLGLSLGLSVGLAHAEGEFLPSHILLMDAKYSHHVLLVEKQSHQLFLFENKDGMPRLLKTYAIATGKFKGNKSTEGDHKTPEGVYDIYEFLSPDQLVGKFGAQQSKIYGAGAFPMNYPNFMDQRESRKGSGIWLHSTDDDNRISKELDSRGCVVAKNQDLREIAQYIDLNRTPIIVTQEANYLTKSTWERTRRDIEGAVKGWMKAWQDKDFDRYIDAYDTSFYDAKKGGYASYRAYKKAIFSKSDKPTIQFDHLSILTAPNYAVAYFQQDYKSENINDLGKKTLFLKKVGDYSWKIVGELWAPTDASAPAFTPANRFFKNMETAVGSR